MDLVLALGGIFFVMWVSYEIGSRYPKHFMALAVMLGLFAAWWTLHQMGKI